MGLFEKKKGDRNPSHLKELQDVAWEEWSKMHFCVCYDLVRNYLKWFLAIIENKDYTIHYCDTKANNFVLC